MTTLSPQNISTLREIAAGGTGGGLYPNTTRPYANAYNYIRSFLGGAVPAAGVDLAVWNWLGVAESVNRGEGQFSNFIRAYTTAQIQIRQNRTLSTAELDSASNSGDTNSGDTILISREFRGHNTN